MRCPPNQPKGTRACDPSGCYTRPAHCPESQALPQMRAERSDHITHQEPVPTATRSPPQEGGACSCKPPPPAESAEWAWPHHTPYGLLDSVGNAVKHSSFLDLRSRGGAVRLRPNWGEFESFVTSWKEPEPAAQAHAELSGLPASHRPGPAWVLPAAESSMGVGPQHSRAALPQAHRDPGTGRPSPWARLPACPVNPGQRRLARQPPRGGPGPTGGLGTKGGG